MSQVCQKCGKGPTSGNNVSHSMRHTKRRFLPNLVTKRIHNHDAGTSKRMKICTKCLKSLSKA